MHVAGAQAGRVGREFPRYHYIVRQVHGAARVFGLVHDAAGSGSEVVFTQRLADIDTLGGKECIGHPPTYDEMLDATDEIGEHVELG